MKQYLNAIYPKSNEIKGTHYLLLIDGQGIHRANTFADVETIVHQAKWNNRTIKKAVRMTYGLPVEFYPETSNERFERENGFERCKREAEELEAYINGNVYTCPECGERLEIPDTVGDKFRCPCCHETNDTSDFEQLGLSDYMEYSLDVDFTINYRKEYKSCSICVAWGGPNVYIDTAERAVILYWGTTHARYSLLSDTIDAIDEYMEEYYNCI